MSWALFVWEIFQYWVYVNKLFSKSSVSSFTILGLIDTEAATQRVAFDSEGPTLELPSIDSDGFSDYFNNTRQSVDCEAATQLVRSSPSPQRTGDSSIDLEGPTQVLPSNVDTEAATQMMGPEGSDTSQNIDTEAATQKLDLDTSISSMTSMVDLEGPTQQIRQYDIDLEGPTQVEFIWS